MEKVNIGIPEEHRVKIVDGLSHLLADTYTLYLKTHNYHWNVTGPSFDTLHRIFMEQYTEMWNAVDLVAERIRTLGAPAPGTYRQFAELSSIKEVDGVPMASDMLKDAMAGHEAVVRTCRKVLPAAQAAGDEGTVNLITDRMGVHEKTAWMLRSMLG